MNDNLPQWTQRARDLLDESALALDAATMSRLNRARQAALARHAPRRRAAWMLMPAGVAGACALLLAVGMWHGRSPQNEPAPAQPAVAGSAMNPADLDLIASGDNLEMMQDLDFYAWLDAQDQDNNG